MAELKGINRDSTNTARLDTSWNVSRILSESNEKQSFGYSYQEVNKTLKHLAPEKLEKSFMQSSLKDLVGLKLGVNRGKFSLDIGQQGRAKFNLPEDIGLDFRYKKSKNPSGESSYNWNLKLSKPINIGGM